jgi:phenylalanyl-tRNA synthetase beta chain
LSEAVTFSFAPDAVAEAFLPTGCKLQRVDGKVRKADANLRPSLLPGLLEAVRRNEALGTDGVRLFETGSAFWYDADGTPVEHAKLGMAGGTYASLRGAVEAVLGRLDAARPVTVRPTSHPGYGEGACGEVIWGDQPVGHIGNCSAAVAKALGLKDVVAVAELALPALLAGHVATPTNRPLQKFPPVVRDVSVVVPEQVPYADVERALRSAEPADLESVRHVTTYRGKPLAKGQKSVTLQLVFRSPDGTLRGEDVDAAVARATEAAKTLASTLAAS